MEKTETKYLFEFYVAGVRFHKLSRCIDSIELGDRLTMTQEPDNHYDPNAVLITFEDTSSENIFKLGYVPAKLAAGVSALMEIKNLYCEVTELTADEVPWKRLKVGIGEEL